MNMKYFYFSVIPISFLFLFIFKSEPQKIDRSLGLFPHEVGNYWIKSNFDNCSGIYRMEVLSNIVTDTADFFEVKHLEAACEDVEERSYTSWYAEDYKGRIFVADNKFNYLCLYVDMKLNIGERYIRMGLMDYVVDKTENRIITEYDSYEDYTANSQAFELGLGLNPESWTTIKIGNTIYSKGIDF